MKLYIIPKPVLNSDMEVCFYCFRYKPADELVSDQPSRAYDRALSSPCFDVLNMAGVNAFSNGLPIFVPLSDITLLMDIENQCNEPADKLIFLLGGETHTDEPFASNIVRLKSLGYRFAIENVIDYQRVKPVLELCDYVFFDSSVPVICETVKKIKRRYNKMLFIASNVNDLNQYNSLMYEHFTLFEGNFYSVPVSKGFNALNPVKVNSIQLMNLVRDDDFEIDEVAKIVGQDPALSIRLLKLANSTLYSGQEIKTIQHAVAMLGQKEVRKWVTTAVSGELASDKPDEITKLSLTRAKFAENLAPYFKMAIHAQSLFLMGLFSILDVVLDMSMERALEIVNVSDDITKALTKGKGNFGKVLHLIKSYESANWNEVSRFVILNEIRVEDIFYAYIGAAQWYGDVVAGGNAAEDEQAG